MTVSLESSGKLTTLSVVSSLLPLLVRQSFALSMLVDKLRELARFFDILRDNSVSAGIVGVLDKHLDVADAPPSLEHALGHADVPHRPQRNLLCCRSDDALAEVDRAVG